MTEKCDSHLIGQRIRDARELARLSKKELAQKVSVAPSTILRYENGKFKDLKVPVVHSIARALGVDPAWLLGYNVPMVHENGFNQSLPQVPCPQADFCIRIENRSFSELGLQPGDILFLKKELSMDERSIYAVTNDEKHSAILCRSLTSDLTLVIGECVGLYRSLK